VANFSCFWNRSIGRTSILVEKISIAAIGVLLVIMLVAFWLKRG